MRPNSGWDRRIRIWVPPLASYTIAAGCLYWIFRDISFREVVASAVHIRWTWIAPAIMADLLTYLCVGWQWRLALRPVGTLPLLKVTQAVFAGRFANDVLPAHVGYVIRVYLASRWLGVGVSRVIPSLLIERLCEGFWLALGIGLAAAFINLPKEVVRAGEILGALLCVGTVLTFFLIRRQKQQPESRCEDWLGRVSSKVLHFVQRLAEGVGGIAGSGLFALIAAAGLLKLIVQGLAFFCLLWAYGLHLPFWVAGAVFLIAYVGISLPSTPAGVGVFQLFCVAGLTLFGIAKPVATGFALLAFVVLTVPLALIGFFALAQSGMSLHDVRTHAREWKREMKADTIR
jgi:glycosyltransferase 2 family protein